MSVKKQGKTLTLLSCRLKHQTMESLQSHPSVGCTLSGFQSLSWLNNRWRLRRFRSHSLWWRMIQWPIWWESSALSHLTLLYGLQSKVKI